MFDAQRELTKRFIQVRSGLRSGYAEVKKGISIWHQESAKPALERVEFHYEHTKHLLHTLEHDTLPELWETKRQEVTATAHTIKRDTFDPFWRDIERLARKWVSKEKKQAAPEQILLSPHIEEQEKKEEHDRHLFKVSSATLGCALASGFYPPLAIVSAAGVVYASVPMLKRAWRSLFHQHTIGNDVLVALSIFALAATGHFGIMALGAWLYFLGSKIQAKARGHSHNMLRDLAQQLPQRVWLVNGKVEIDIPLEDLHVHDVVAVHTGEIIPTDGMILEGQALLDQHLLTGEFQPAEKGCGDVVLASTMVMNGKILVRVEKTGNDTVVAHISRIVLAAAEHQTEVQLKGQEWADKAALPILCTAGAAFLLWDPVSAAIILKSGIGNRIRLLAPLGTLNYLNLASQTGILVKDGQALERLKDVDTILFDKTGTLTAEQPVIGRIITCAREDERTILRYAAAAERRLHHPIAKAIVQAAQDRGIPLPDIPEANYRIGYGVMLHWQGKLIRVGSAQFMRQAGVPLEALAHTLNSSHHAGHTLVMVAVNQRLIGGIEIQAAIRPEITTLIQNLRQHGVQHIAIVSGDHIQPTRTLAEALGTDDYFFEVLPADKARIVEQLQQEGHTVCFVGDGVNDSVAMKQANVSMSLQGASSIATDAAQIVFMDGRLTNMTELFRISRELHKNLRTSLLITLVPSLFNIGGVFLFDEFDLIMAYLIKKAGLLAGLGNAMSPSIREHHKNAPQHIGHPHYEEEEQRKKKS